MTNQIKLSRNRVAELRRQARDAGQWSKREAARLSKQADRMESHLTKIETTVRFASGKELGFSDDETPLPVFVPRPVRGTLATVKFKCPGCGRIHYHGDLHGHRVAHCPPDSPFYDGGYYLALS